MIDTGDIHLADLNEERRRKVLIISNHRFNRIAGRAVVAPSISSEPAEISFPWRIEVDGDVYAVDLLRSITTDRLLGRVGNAPLAAVLAARRAVVHIC